MVFAAGFAVGLALLALRAVQVCAQTPGYWMLERSLEMTLPSSAILPIWVAERLSDSLKDPRTKAYILGRGPAALGFWLSTFLSPRGASLRGGGFLAGFEICGAIWLVELRPEQPPCLRRLQAAWDT